jgi:hypothetical protein
MGFCATARMVLFVHDCLLRRRRVAVNDTDIHLGNAILEALPQLALNFPHLNLGEYIIITDICRWAAARVAGVHASWKQG